MAAEQYEHQEVPVVYAYDTHNAWNHHITVLRRGEEKLSREESQIALQHLPLERWGLGLQLAERDIRPMQASLDILGGQGWELTSLSESTMPASFRRLMRPSALTWQYDYRDDFSHLYINFLREQGDQGWELMTIVRRLRDNWVSQHTSSYSYLYRPFFPYSISKRLEGSQRPWDYSTLDFYRPFLARESVLKRDPLGYKTVLVTRRHLANIWQWKWEETQEEVEQPIKAWSDVMEYQRQQGWSYAAQYIHDDVQTRRVRDKEEGDYDEMYVADSCTRVIFKRPRR